MVAAGCVHIFCQSFFLFLIGTQIRKVNAYFIDDTPGLGRQFDGFGGLSGGGATSKLLVNYPEQQRNEILDYLFKPNFGASLHILKVDIGGDAQSTDGTESSHMHESWDENYQRGYEWWLMVEAKKRNPQIKLYGLPWAFPGWVTNEAKNPYVYPTVTADYIIRWIKGAKKYYNLDIDYIGIWNENHYNLDYIEILRTMLDQNNLTSVHIVAADDFYWQFAHEILTNSTIAKAVDYIGVHYPGTMSTAEALSTGKQLWSSEDYSTFNDNNGAGCWARILNQNYVNGYMTSTIAWDLIAAYYEALPGGRCGLMSAMEPWSGNYDVAAPIWMTAHTTQFVQKGWHYLKHDNGVGKLRFGGSYVSLMSPDGKDFTLIVEKMSYNHSKCVRPQIKPYYVNSEFTPFTLQGDLAKIQQLNVWYSQLNFTGGPDVLFKQLDPVVLKDGQFFVSIDVDVLYTFSTISTATKGSYSAPPVSKPFPLPYKDDYEGYVPFTEPYMFAPQVGVFEVRSTNDSQHKQVMRQVVLRDPVYWCSPVAQPRPITLGGDYSWQNISVQTDVYVPSVNGSQGVFVATRVSKGGCGVTQSAGIFFFAFPGNRSFVVTADIAATKILTNGSISSFNLDTWKQLSIVVKSNAATGLFNRTQLFTITLPSSVP